MIHSFAESNNKMSFALDEKMFVKVGPRGGTVGKVWDELFDAPVKEIFIRYGQTVNSIQIMYDRSGKLSLCERRGGDGDNFDIIELDEPLVCIRGYYSRCNEKSANSDTVIESLAFETRKKVFGLYGRKRGISFCFRSSRGFGGFHGRSDGKCLYSIGVYVECFGSPLHDTAASSTSKRKRLSVKAEPEDESDS